ncbi:MAG TPA: aminotransferase class I/II-fold pyridoxal phosphate-dependent enzyme [Gemmatimonadaceae bacterium]|nr:aminotransferase class I/II-fold pyridoxal phosphate-dependent enzyme [Gemmatimonadaceae bacterium]
MPVARTDNTRTPRSAGESSVAGCSTLVALLRFRAETMGDRVVYRFLPGDGKAEQTVTYRELDRRARSLAVAIRERARAGDRALLLIPPGLDYVAAYFACLYARVIAVPAYPPNPRRPDPRIPSIARDCEPTVALTSGALLAKLDQWRGGDERLGAVHWIAADTGVSDASQQWSDDGIAADDVAMLQYTSGSTASPKGVVLTHGNLLHNLALIRSAFPVEHAVDDVGCFWLPPFHDMGLIGGILQPCYVGRGAVLMSSATFLQRPLSWLEAMSTYRATTSAAPNFAFDLCVERIKPDEIRDLDLSSWHTVFDGAEPIRAETIDRFSRTFEDAGFRREAFFPCYGLAEATLFVAGGPWGHGPYTLDVSRAALERKRVVPATAGDRLRLVSSGAPAPGQTVRIVDPETREERADRRIGEIWVAGDSVAQGYWRNAVESAATFGATVAGEDRHTFLRTGDLGFLDDGQLFVTGRLKDLIILNGRNYYPQDLEIAAERSHPSLRPGHSAAFAMNDDAARERLVIALEVTRHHRESDHESVFSAVRRALAEREGILPDIVVLVRQNGIPRTSSGKVQRRATRAMLADGSLDVVGRSDQTIDDVPAPPLAAENGAPLEAWLRRWVADELQIDVTTVDATASVRDYGLDSVAAVRLVTELERVLGHRVDVSLLWREPSIRSLSRALDVGGERTAPLDIARDVAERTVDERQVSPLPASEFPEFRLLQARLDDLERHGLENPYFRVHEGSTGSTAIVEGRELINFANYNYLGLSGDPRVNAAVVEAVRRYGTSVSASRIVSGERPIHRELEQELASFIGVEDCVLYIGGVTTNVSTISHLLGPGDVVLCDELLHNSAMQGALFSGAQRLTFPHNDVAAADRLLSSVRARYRRALIVIEGVYSADGDVPDLARFVAMKKRHEAWLMVDEAHSIGVLGATGRGLAEHAGVSPRAVDLWMGTLSKSLASVGGYIGARSDIVKYLKYTAPGFVFSVGMAPANVAAALEALRILRREPDRVRRLHDNAALFLRRAKEHGLNTGSSSGTPIVPVITGDSIRAVRLSQQLLHHGINVQPMVAPAVSESAARLRFFLASGHTAEQIDRTVASVASLLDSGA